MKNAPVVDVGQAEVEALGLVLRDPCLVFRFSREREKGNVRREREREKEKNETKEEKSPKKYISPMGLTGKMILNPVLLGSASASLFSLSLRSSSISFLKAGSRRYLETLARRVSTFCCFFVF